MSRCTCDRENHRDGCPAHPDNLPLPTLTEFLLARIAEDEQGTATMTHRPTAAHMLAECEAKRRIVERAQRASEAFAQSIDPTTSGVAMTMDLVLADLALPYADHPDYREEWRP